MNIFTVQHPERLEFAVVDPVSGSAQRMSYPQVCAAVRGCHRGLLVRTREKGTGSAIFWLFVPSGDAIEHTASGRFLRNTFSVLLDMHDEKSAEAARQARRITLLVTHTGEGGTGLVVELVDGDGNLSESGEALLHFLEAHQCK